MKKPAIPSHPPKKKKERKGNYIFGGLLLIAWANHLVSQSLLRKNSPGANAHPPCVRGFAGDVPRPMCTQMD